MAICSGYQFDWKRARSLILLDLFYSPKGHPLFRALAGLEDVDMSWALIWTAVDGFVIPTRGFFASTRAIPILTLAYMGGERVDVRNGTCVNRLDKDSMRCPTWWTEARTP